MSSVAGPVLLVVNDDESTLEATARVLRREGFEVREAATGTEALRLAGDGVDLVILDIALRDVDGIETCRRLKAGPATAAIPILHLSGPDRRDRARALESGGDGYLVSPPDPDELVATVRLLLRLRQTESALRQSEERFHALSGQTVVYEWSAGSGDRGFHFQTSLSPLRDSTGAIVGIVGSDRDVTERIRAERTARALADVGRKLVETLDLDQAMSLVVESLPRLFGIRRALLFRLDADRRSLVCVAHAGEGTGDDWMGRLLPVGAGVAGLAAAEGRVVWTSDAVNDPRVTPPESPGWSGWHDEPAAVVGVPLKVRDDVLGALVMADTAGRVFEEDELRSMSAFADQAALALENAGLYTDLRQAKEFLQSIVENSADAIVAIDLQGRISYFSPGAEEMFGFRATQALGASALGYLAGGADQAQSLGRRLASEGRLTNHEMRIRASGGRWVDASASLSFLRDAGGRATGVLAVVTDVTEQKRAAEALRVSEARLRAAIDALPFDFWLCDHDGRYTVLNATCIHHWGDRIGRRPSETAVDPAVAALWEQNNARALAGEVVRGEMELPVRGERRVRSHVVVPYRVAGEINGTLGISVDVTEQKRAEQEAVRRRRTAETLADLVQAVSQSLDPAEVAQRIVHAAETLLGARHVGLLELEDQTGDLVVCAASLGSVFVPGTWFPAGAGLVGLAVAQRRVMTTANVLADPRVTLTPELRARMESADFRAVVTAPLVIRGKVAGALAIADGAGRIFDEEAMALAQAFAGHAAVALERSRLFAESERRRREAEALAMAARRIAESLDVERVAEQVVQSAVSLLGMRAGIVRLLDREGAAVSVTGVGNMGEYISKGDSLPAGVGIAGAVVATGRPAWSSDLGEDREYPMPEATRERLRRSRIRANLVVPLRVKDAIIGVLGVSDEVVRPFSESEVALLQAFADHVAIALEHARLYGETERRRAEVEVLADLAREINRPLSLDATLQKVAEGAKALLGSDRTIVALREPSSDAVRVRYGAGVPPGELIDLVIEPGRGHGGIVLGTGRASRTECYATDVRFTADYLPIVPDVVAQVVVPIRIESRIEGLLYAENTSPRAFTDRDEEVLVQLAEHAAIAIRNAQLFTSEQEARARAEAASGEARIRATQQAAMAGVGLRALRPGDLQAILDEAVSVVARTLDVEYAALLDLLPGERGFLVQAGVGWEPELVGRLVVETAGRSQAGYTMLSGGPVIVEDVARERRFPPCPLLRERGVTSGASVIVHGPDRPFGVLSAHTTRPRIFSADDVNFLQGIANVLAAAIESQRTAVALRSSESRYRRIVETAQEGIWMLDADATTTYVNQRMAGMLGYTVEELIGRHLFEFLEEPQQRQAARNLALARQGRKARVESLLRRKDGGAVWALVSVNPVFDDDGRFAGALGMLTDISELKRAGEERARLLAEERQARGEAEAAAARMRALQRVTETALAPLGLDDLLAELLRPLREAMRTDMAGVLLLDEDGQDLVVRANEGFEGFLNLRVPLGRGVAGRIAATGRPMAVEELCAFDVVNAQLRERLRSLAGAPLIVHDRIIGVVDVGTIERRCFTEDDLTLLELIAHPIAAAIERARLFEAVSAARARLEALSLRLVEVQETERRAIARELHDEIGQLLTALKLTLALTEREASGRTDGAPSGPPSRGAGGRLDDAAALVEELVSRVRELSLDLRPAMLDDLGLVPALAWYVDRYTARTGIAVAFRHTGADGRFPPAIETGAFRIVQEALTNVARHARSDDATVRLWAGDDLLNVQIEDHGVGFDPARAIAVTSSGLSGMRERATLLGGRLEVESTPGSGACITAELPVTRAG
jgi:PAS domain S-box-containing protein